MLKQGDEFEDIEAEPLLIRLSRECKLNCVKLQ